MPSIDQVRKKADQRLGVLGPILDRRGGPSIRNRVLLYKQLIWPMMDLFPIWRYGVCTHVRGPQVLQSKCLCIAAGAPRYGGNRQIQVDLGVSFSADHANALTESFNSKLAGVGNSLVRHLSRYLSIDPCHLKHSPCMTEVSRPVEAAQKMIASLTQ